MLYSGCHEGFIAEVGKVVTGQGPRGFNSMYVARTRSFIEGKGLGDKSERSSSLVEILPENFYDFVSRYRDFKHMHCHFM